MRLCKYVCFLFIVFTCASKTDSKQYLSIAGPFKVNVKRIEKCPGEVEGPNHAKYWYEVRKRPNALALWSGNASLPFTIDDSLVFKGSLASWSNNGGWKPNAYRASFKNLCRLAFTHFKPHVEYGMNLLFGETLACPFPPGLFREYNFTIPEHLLAATPSFLRNFVYGRWRAEGRLFTKDGEMVGCNRALIETLPK